MPGSKKVMLVFGTRPEAIKLAPVVLALRDVPELDVVVTVTAQHGKMLDQVLDLFGITAQHDLRIIQERQSLAGVTTRALDGLSPIIEEERPDLVVVQGDTTTTLTGALAAFYQGVPVAHVEAGLRSGDLSAPFPEEANRRLTSVLTALHLTPTWSSRANLLREGADPEGVVVTGNTVIDALRWAVARGGDYGEPALADLDRHKRPVLLVTAHRRESWGDPLVGLGKALGEIARAEPELLVVFPIHRNPVVREAVLPGVAGQDNVLVVEPLTYGGFARLMQRSKVILTDSGGIQEEGPSLGKPVLVMRDSTERPEAVEAGTARLIGTGREAIRDAVLDLLHDPIAYDAMATAVSPYGDGRAAARTRAAIEHFLELGPPPEPFRP